MPSARACLGGNAANPPRMSPAETTDEEDPMDVSTVTQLLREAEEHHGTYEATAPVHHWSDWYAAYIVAREQGRSQDEAVRDATQHMDSICDDGSCRRSRGACRAADAAVRGGHSTGRPLRHRAAGRSPRG